MPHVDELRPIHNLESMRQLCEALNTTNPRIIDPKAWLQRVA